MRHHYYVLAQREGHPPTLVRQNGRLLRYHRTGERTLQDLAIFKHIGWVACFNSAGEIELARNREAIARATLLLAAMGGFQAAKRRSTWRPIA